MSFTDQLNQNTNQQGADYMANVKAITMLEGHGHTIVAKGTQAAYIDGYLMIFLYMNSYENHRTGKRGDFEPGKITELLDEA